MGERPTTVLLIENHPQHTRQIEQILTAGKTIKYHVHCADRLTDGLEHLAEGGIDVLLLNLDLPDSHGMETLQKTASLAPEVPIVVLTNQEDDPRAAQALQEGAQDYLVNGELTAPLLVRSLRYAIERQQLQAALGSMIHDTLTRLYNRSIFLTLAEHHLKLASRNKQAASLLFADVDQLKTLNEMFGFREGNRVLLKTASLLRQVFRSSDILARVGGDEFAVLMINTTAGCDDMLRMRLQLQLQQLNARADRRYVLSVNSGIARFDPAQPCSINELLGRAAEALFAEKDAKQQVRKPAATPEPGSARTKDTMRIRRPRK